jgi:hypothetical protein
VIGQKHAKVNAKEKTADVNALKHAKVNSQEKMLS